MRKLLVVEDDRNLGETLQERLSKEGYHAHLCRTLKEAQGELSSKSFDLVLLDLTLPDGSGFDLAEKMRLNNTAPIVFMTAHSDSENRLRGYELGAYEFIPKPFHLRELLLRIKHVFDNHGIEDILRVGPDCVVDIRAMCIVRRGQKQDIAARDFQILKTLIELSPKVVSRDEILNLIWGEDHFPTPRTVDNSIVRLRSALGDEDGQFIKSIRGMGYQWQGVKQ